MSSPVDADPILTIESGAQSGARTTISPGLHSVGADLGSDVVLFDPVLAGTHLTLEREAGEREPGGIRLRALGGPVSLADGTELAPGEATLCRGSTRFRAGGTSFRLDNPRTAQPRPARRLPARRLTGRAALVGLGLGAACTLAAAVGITLAAAPTAEAVLPPARAEAKAAPVRPASPVAGVLEAVRARLASAGFETVSLAALPDGSVAARGQIAPPQEAAWRDVERWFDGAYGGRAVLVDQVRVAAEAPPLAVQAVWPGRNPYVVDGSGEKLFVGAPLPGGWTIEGISAERILLRRGGQTLAVRF